MAASTDGVSHDHHHRAVDDEYVAAVKDDAESDDENDAALAAVLRPLSGASASQGKPPQSARTTRRSPSATSDIALGQPSQTTRVHRPASGGPQGNRFAGSRPVSARVPAPPGTGRPTSAKRGGTSLSEYGIMARVAADRGGASATGSRPATARSRVSHAPGAGDRCTTSGRMSSRAVADQARAFSGARTASPTAQHQPTRPGSLAFRPPLSRATQLAVEEHAKYRFDTVVRKKTNHDMVLEAHQGLSLNPPADEEPSDVRALSVEGRAAIRIEEARKRRAQLQSRLQANLPSHRQPGTRETVAEELAQAAALLRSTSAAAAAPTAECSGSALLTTATGVPPVSLDRLPDAVGECMAQQRLEEELEARMTLQRELGFRTAYHEPRNDDLRTTYAASGGLGNHHVPYVAPNHVFAMRASASAVAAAYEDADAAADAARKPRDSRPTTPRTVSRFFNRGAEQHAPSATHNFDADTYEAQDDRYSDALRRAVRDAMRRHDVRPKRTAASPRTLGQGAPAAAESQPNAAMAGQTRGSRRPQQSPRRAAAPVPSELRADPGDVHAWVRQVRTPRQ